MSSTLPGEIQSGDLLADLAAYLHHLGLASLAAALLEAGAPFTPLLAQGIYMSQPLLEPWLASERLDTLATLLEDESQTSALVLALRAPHA